MGLREGERIGEKEDEFLHFECSLNEWSAFWWLDRRKSSGEPVILE
jgi:hypothetical protein